MHLLKFAREGLVTRRLNLTKGKSMLQTNDVQDGHAASTGMDVACMRAYREDSHR